MAIRTRSCLIRKRKEHILASSLTIENVSAGYGAVRVLSDVTLAAGDGETVVLLGTNGNGKSTVIKCVTGQVRPTQGRIVAEIDGKRHEVGGMATEDIVARRLRGGAEGGGLFPKLPVEENLLIGG